ncbi:nitroreductase family protein [Desulfospira joergensenii]|uniref:nitroreductase family protein n=1 Tax=Desulfospira joergensenii TaxID=53329 RepID=UPI0003B42C5A|nr:nitroreductase family protein [Desulfospira joergensenii]
MSLFKIDLDRCDKDGICAIECPAHIIRMGPEGPVPVAGAEEACIRCGHCVAVCPKGAFCLDFLSPDQCMPLEKEWVLGEERVEHFLRSRRSIRRYKDKSVPRNIFEKALGIACCAPTGSNRQPVKWLVVDKKEDVAKIAGQVIDWMRYMVKEMPEVARTLNMEILVAQWDKGIDRICRDAPFMVFAHAASEIGSAGADCHTALAYLELALTGFGLGSCWAGYVNYAAGHWPDLKKTLNLPRDHSCHGALMVGYPKFRYERAPKRNPPDIHYLGR